MTSLSGGVEDKYGCYIKAIYKWEVFYMIKGDWIYHRGDIYLAKLVPRIGFVQSGTRPVIVLQNNCGNFFAPTLIVAPLSSNINKKRDLPTHYYLEGSGILCPSLILLEQITTIDKRQVIKYIGKVDRVEMDAISECVEKSLGLYIPEEMEAP